jgi:sec-independent protein translocase protein TatC
LPGPAGLRYTRAVGVPRKNPNEMTFLEHLEELRQRIIRVVIALAVGTAACFYFAGRILNLLLAPAGTYFQYFTPAEAFVVHLKVAFFSAIVVTSPYTFWQVWRFVSPGLLPKEKRFAIPFVFFTVLCFAAGVAVGYTLLIPAMKFFRSFETDRLIALWSLDAYVSLVTRLMLATGLVFETPVLVFFLAKLGIVSPGMMLKGWRYVVVAAFILAAVLTPTADPITCSALAAPLLLLYLVSVVVAWIFYPRRKRKPAGEGTDETEDFYAAFEEGLAGEDDEGFDEDDLAG